MLTDQNTPTAICNQALDAAGLDFFLGDIEEGTRPSQVCLRHYTECLRQLLRCAMWDFARKEVPAHLLADGSGQTSGVGTVVPGNQFIYEYAYPTDCAKIRYIPWNPLLAPGTPTGNIAPANPSSPVVSGLGAPPYQGRGPVPSRFLVTSDQNYIDGGEINQSPGISPLGRTVVLSNVKNATLIYTYDAVYPNVWDHQFRAAMVAYLASEIAMPLATDKKLGLTLRDRNIGIAMEKIRQARVSDGNEGWSSSDLTVDWMRARNSGGEMWNDGTNAGPGILWGGYDSIGFANGSSF